MRSLALLLLSYLIAMPAATHAVEAPVVELTGHTTASDLAGHIEAHLDLSGTETIQTVRDAPFRLLTTRGVDFGYTHGAVWMRFRLKNLTPDTAEWRLHFRENFLPEMDVHAFAPGAAPVLIDRTVKTSTFADRAIAYPEVTIPLSLPPGSEKIVYVMYRSDGSTQTSFEIRTRAGFEAYSAARTARNFVFYGMILFLAVAATLAFMITRLGVFAAYGAYAAAGLIFMMHADGNAFQYLWPHAPAFNNYASILTGTAFIVTGAMFARVFLQTARRHVVMDRLLLAVILLSIGMVVSTIVVETQLVKKLLVLLAFIGILLFTASGLVAARTRFREVRFYVFAWTGALFASGMMTSRHWFGIDISEDTQLDAMRVVMVFDAAFMGLAILDRFNQLKQARQRAMRLSLEQARRSLGLSRRLSDLEKQYALATELAEARGRRLSDTAHDLRQPLHALRLTVQSIISAPGQPGSGGEEVEKTFAYLEELVASELNESVGSTRAADPPSSGHSAEPVGIGEILGGVRDMFVADAADKALDLRVMPTSARTTVPPLALMRLVSNLMVNAIKYTDEGRVLVGVRPAGDHVHLEVHDTGPGLDEDTFRRMLGRSVRLEPTAATPGAGLGLAIVDEIVSTHGLEIGLLPRESRGTSIRVVLPAA